MSPPALAKMLPKYCLCTQASGYRIVLDKSRVRGTINFLSLLPGHSPKFSPPPPKFREKKINL